MIVKTDPRAEIKKILPELENVSLMEVQRNKEYKFLRANDNMTVGILKKVDGEWVLEAWMFEVRNMKCVPVRGDEAYGTGGYVYFPKCFESNTVAETLKWMEFTARKARNVEIARNEALKVFAEYGYDANLD